MFRILKNEKGFLLLTAMILLFFVTNLMMTASSAYDSRYRAYDALKIAGIQETKNVLNSIQKEKTGTD
ncbi:hypothetical protein [Rummeliibacillus pycnus]|uniref:hypothetical protein n=1 Tax=Rummeliibacillus pycnus TaxID=101070 RepID=UPI003D2CEDE2